MVGAAAAAVFVLVLTAVLSGWSPLSHLDRAVAETAARWGQGAVWWVPVWAGASVVLAPWTFRALALVALLVLVVRHRSSRVRSVGRPSRAVASPTSSVVLPAAVAVIVCGLVPVTVKALVDRPRPSEALVAAAQSSFPSAHAFGAVVGVGAVLAVLHRWGGTSARRWRSAAGVLAVLLVCTARVMLAVHYVSDVVAGAALGIVWLALAWVASSSRRGSALPRARM